MQDFFGIIIPVNLLRFLPHFYSNRIIYFIHIHVAMFIESKQVDIINPVCK